MGFYSASQLVQDAKRHGIEILPVCVNQSTYDHSLAIATPGELSAHKFISYQHHIRLGLRLVKGLSEQGAKELIEKRPADGYSDINSLYRLGLNQRDMEALASANALRDFASNRYTARWALMNNPKALALESNLPSPEQTSAHHINEASPYHYQPSGVDNLIEDYASLQLSLAHHPITLLEQSGCLGHFTRANQLAHIKHQSFVDIAGLVTGKQSPGTASGVTFMTLEDDTGNINVVIWAGTARAQKRAYLSAKILKIKGILEREGEVVHVIAGKLEDMTEQLAGLQSRSRDFH
jgi:error-prone DNA polymerase